MEKVKEDNGVVKGTTTIKKRSKKYGSMEYRLSKMQLDKTMEVDLTPKNRELQKDYLRAGGKVHAHDVIDTKDSSYTEDACKRTC